MDSIEKLREKIDNIDQEVLTLIEERMRHAEAIGKFKKEKGLPFVDENREEAIINSLIQSTDSFVIKDVIPTIFEPIIALARSQQVQAKLPFNKIGIIGLGLMGGSIAKACKISDPNVEIWSIKEGRRTSFIDVVTNDFEEMIAAVELVVLAMPISNIVDCAKQIRECVCQNRLVVLDIGSVKEEITDSFEKLTDNSIEFVATHPMAGSEKSGINASRGDLFVQCSWIITPHQKNSVQTISRVEKWIRCLQSNAIVLSPKQHDRYVALISHMVGILSKELLHFVEKEEPKSLEIAGPGFHSMTRLAKSNSAMREDIYRINRKNIENYLKRFREHLCYVESS